MGHGGLVGFHKGVHGTGAHLVDTDFQIDFAKGALLESFLYGKGLAVYLGCLGLEHVVDGHAVLGIVSKVVPAGIKLYALHPGVADEQGVVKIIGSHLRESILFGLV